MWRDTDECVAVYSGSGASTPGATRGEGADGEEGEGEEQRVVAHHVDLLGSLPAPAALLAIDRLRESQKRRLVGLVTIYQLVEADGEGGAAATGSGLMSMDVFATPASD